MMMNRKSLFIFLGVVVATASACSDHATLRGSEDPPVAVKTTTLAPGEIPETFEAGGVVQARTSAVVTARILAPIREVRVKPGDRVRAGQVLVVLEGADLGAQARSARAAATAADQATAAAIADQQSADAALTLARAVHSRIASLHAKRSATPQELDEATAALRRAEAAAASADARVKGAGAGRESARAAADASTTTASFATITAPFSGIVTEKLVEAGNMAAPGTPLIRLEDTRGFRLETRIDESRASDVAPGTPVRVTLDSGRSIEGRVAEVARAVDADSRAFLIKIDLPAGEDVRSGQFGRANFSRPPRRGLTLPADAVTTRGQVTSVFVVDNGIARLRLVSVRGSEVLAGLDAGDVVIVNPPPGLTDGRRVSTGGQR